MTKLGPDRTDVLILIAASAQRALWVLAISFGIIAACLVFAACEYWRFRPAVSELADRMNAAVAKIHSQSP